MPNGRSGGFVIETADLKRLLDAVPDDTVVGRLTTGLKPEPARRQEIARLIEECPHSSINVEEQDHASYIVHLSRLPNLAFLVVSSGSPLFQELRRRHEQWMRDHPGWNGWIGF